MSFYIPNEGHVVNILAPVDINGGAVSSDVFSMENYAHVDIIIQLGVTGAASTVTVEECDDFTPTTCAFSTAADVAYQFVAPATRTYIIDTVGSTYDTVLYVLDGCGGRELACNDDTFGLQSQVRVSATAGQVLIIVVDGFSTAQGSFVLNIN